jgi:hypothetical protein
MIPPLECRLRASECQKMASQAPNMRVRDILLDMARTWMRLALEAEEWSRINKPSVRLTKTVPTSPQVEPTPFPFHCAVLGGNLARRVCAFLGTHLRLACCLGAERRRASPLC